ncbi:acetoacetyl-CoA synthetase [Burkholderia pseudomallei MSHR338]|uniref:acetoacetate--CoA ligase n=1 Tax=Burkholderia pseudomallei TaxID=28450 RepID=UPI0001A488B6|nr:acetoacetate--CoA ligase [Burkholderia pseudomallei]ACQ97489.1 acetoacetate-CoA ligase [Burkholderia pseudomallei MSHR346]EQA90442.1 acetoacetyl-CoA synthetase [Burkholderia pseudomallei MSHR338]OMW31628.1 acetoacetyl-CoA synthetase [Burkholderia pseudomallei]ONA26224.1 acetoacetyl-CoA synthetase [Burkholderia pseudomallei]ONA35463.1 acetoacetyl-CoA synthetase [Burkholderia pseudomallei]
MSPVDFRHAAPAYVPQIRLFQDWLLQEKGLIFDTYDELWRWSVTDLEAFWDGLWTFGGMQSLLPYTDVLLEERMPGARWFSGAQVNYAQQVFRHAGAAHGAGMPAIVSEDELGRVRELSWPELRRRVASLALTLKVQGVQRGDRVAAYLPNIPETAIAFLACCSIGAIWSVCAPNMGLRAVADRFRQIEPRVLIAVDGVHYAGSALDRSAVVEALRQALPSVEKLIVLQTPFAAGRVDADLLFEDTVARNDVETAVFEAEWLPFDHPLWIVYSSGTTGLPKAFVHGHGGVLMTAMSTRLHTDLGPSYAENSYGERYHWYSSTSWIMWNAQIAGLLFGTTICLYDGSPGGSKDNLDWGVLWRFAARHKVTYFGAGAAFHSSCMKAGLSVDSCGDLTRIRALGSTGSPLAEEVQRWGSQQFEQIGTPNIWWINFFGGTDLCGNFATGNRELPQTPGRLQCRQLGASVEAWDEEGKAVTGEVGELVCTRPIPGMPLILWGDAGNSRYRSSYFDFYPGVWRQGDWIQIDPDGSCIVCGRSDATINRGGLRMGSGEIYSAVEAQSDVLDSLVVDLEYLGGDSHMILFVTLREGQALNAELSQQLLDAVKRSLSPRFVPDQIFHAPAIPRTLSGQKQELPIKRLFLGHAAEKVVNREAMANPECLDWYIERAALHLAD